MCPVMSADPLPPPSERRHDRGLSFDPEVGRLQLGPYSRDLGATFDNRAVLVAYVELTARSRMDRVANVVEVRHDDVEALARALDLDADDLGHEIERVLGATRAEALQTVLRLKESRHIGGIARAAISS